MNDLTATEPKRKVLSLKIEPDERPRPQTKPPYHKHFVIGSEAIYMVFNPNGHMPKRVYASNERKRAIGHAKRLAAEVGERFYVLRAWRGYDPGDE